ncbi:hypothetical protein PC120_g21402 [Phytophthora cactorum]|nr:hypothetical protein PC120_g21402 [Phytophthora cactorum]
MLDGLKDKSTNYIAVFATLMHDGRFQEVLLGFSPPLDEKKYTAQVHRDLTAFILGIYKKKLSNITVLIGDNCPTNTATTDLLGVPLLGCARHKLSLALKKFIKEQVGAEAAIDSLRTMDKFDSDGYLERAH